MRIGTAASAGAGDHRDGGSRAEARSVVHRGPSGPVLRRAARILEAFTAERPTLGVSELARLCDLPLTTTHRLVKELTACGFLERDSADRLHIGLKLFELGSLAPQERDLRTLALPFMEDLFQVTAENVQLAVREGLEAVFVERISGRSAVPVMNRVGGRFPLYPTGVGRVLLAHAPVEVQEQVLASKLMAFTPATTTSPSALRRLLAEVRTRQYAVNNGEVTLDTVSVAAPVRNAADQVVAALSIVVSAATATIPSLVPVVQATARGITRSLRTAGITM
jgi:DNA-binding IclR family transcriptional regulator